VAGLKAHNNSIVVGVMGNDDGMRVIQGSSGGPVYHYGYPAYGASESNVVAQWLFDEASGSIVDEVSGISCSPQGSPTYAQAKTGKYSGISPGIDTTSGWLDNLGAQATMTASCHALTVEWWFSCTETVSGWSSPWFHSNDANAGYWSSVTPSTGLFEFVISSDLSTPVYNKPTMPTGWNDGNPHKIRITMDANYLTTRFDGVVIGTPTDISTAIGNITIPLLRFGAYTHGGSSPFKGITYEFRQSNNSTNNSGGPGGG
jgi:hypothetical protein